MRDRNGYWYIDYIALLALSAYAQRVGKKHTFYACIHRSIHTLLCCCCRHHHLWTINLHLSTHIHKYYRSSSWTINYIHLHTCMLHSNLHIRGRHHCQTLHSILHFYADTIHICLCVTSLLITSHMMFLQIRETQDSPCAV